MIFITRNDRDYGPYDINTLTRFVYEGKLLLHDKAFDSSTGIHDTLGHILTRYGVKATCRHEGSVLSQLAKIGREFIFPVEEINRQAIIENHRLLLLAAVGLSLSVIMLLPIGGYLMFYIISLYFATIWGLFFAYFFRTHQVSIKTTIYTFFMTQLGVFVIFSGLNNLNFFYIFTSAPFPNNLLGFILGVGVTEELTKMIPLLIIRAKAKQPLTPQTMVYYGLMAGIAFGVFEGVQYQTTVNIQADYTTAFVLNIARLTSLPFLHAMFTGIAGYFVGMAGLYPRYRQSLYLLALAIPAILHGCYDSLAGVSYPVALGVAFLSVILLMAYLKKNTNFREKLRH